MPSCNEREPTLFFARSDGPDRATAERATRRRWLSRRLVPAAAALALVGLPVPALASRGTVHARPSAVGASLDPCPHGDIQRDYLHFRIFACKNGRSALNDIKIAGADLNDLWRRETKLMGDPVRDYALPGEFGRIDFYLVTKGQTLTREGHKPVDLAKLGPRGALGAAPWDVIKGTVSSGFVVALRPESLPKGDSFKSVLAHEFFHVLQWAHNTTLSCPDFWFRNASAKWAEWYFVPEAAGRMVYPWFRDFFQAKPEVSLTDSQNRESSADWAWPLFMQQQAGGSPDPIALAWKAMEGEEGCTALNADISLEDSFDRDFGPFAVENFDYRLPNQITGKQAWPVNFGDNYLDFRTASNPKAAKFPEETPAIGFPDNNGRVKVDLPPLSAQYTDTGGGVGCGHCGNGVTSIIGSGGSVRFDFSGLSPSNHLWISLIASDWRPQGQGYASHNGTWQRIDLPAGDKQAKICLNADATKVGLVAGRPLDPLDGEIYVIIANTSSGPSAAPIKGSYTVATGPCATAVSGTVTVNLTIDEGTPGLPDTVHQNATLNMDLVPNGQSEDWQSAGGSWSEQYTSSSSCGDGTTDTVTASGSGSPITGTVVSSLPDDLPTANFYDNPYFSKPFISSDLLEGENLQGTESGGSCGTSGPVTVGGEITEVNCPANTADLIGLVGHYTAHDAGVDFTCSASWNAGFPSTITVSGTLTATNPILCGLWTKKCPIGTVAPIRRDQRASKLHAGLAQVKP